jgi:ketosteroid isomerase-like protein
MDKDQVRKSLEAQTAKFAEAFNKEDLDGVMAPYWNSPELVAMYPDGDYRGYAALRESWKKTFDGVTVKKFEITEQHFNITPHVVTEWGMWSYAFQPTGGPDIMLQGRYLLTWEEKDGKWVITVDHASCPLPPPPAG